MRFLIDANGILNVTARDARTGKEQSIDVQPSYGLTLEQTEAMIDDAIAHGEEDLHAAQVALGACGRRCHSTGHREGNP